MLITFFIFFLLVFFFPYIFKILSGILSTMEDITTPNPNEFIKAILSIFFLFTSFSGFAFLFLKIASYIF